MLLTAVAPDEVVGTEAPRNEVHHGLGAGVHTLLADQLRALRRVRHGGIVEPVARGARLHAHLHGFGAFSVVLLTRQLFRPVAVIQGLRHSGGCCSTGPTLFGRLL